MGKQMLDGRRARYGRRLNTHPLGDAIVAGLLEGEHHREHISGVIRLKRYAVIPITPQRRCKGCNHRTGPGEGIRELKSRYAAKVIAAEIAVEMHRVQAGVSGHNGHGLITVVIVGRGRAKKVKPIIVRINRCAAGIWRPIRPTERRAGPALTTVIRSVGRGDDRRQHGDAGAAGFAFARSLGGTALLAIKLPVERAGRRQINRIGCVITGKSWDADGSCGSEIRKAEHRHDQGRMEHETDTAGALHAEISRLACLAIGGIFGARQEFDQTNYLRDGICFRLIALYHEFSLQ